MPSTKRSVTALHHTGVEHQTGAPADQRQALLGDGLTRVLVLAALVLLYAPTVGWLFDRWTMSVWHNAHGMFIPPIVAYFIYEELRERRGAAPSASPWGFAVLIVALTIHVFDVGMHTQLLSAFSIVVALPGLSLLFLGAERTKAIMFPLALLAFMLPIPLALTEPLHLGLRQLATDASASLLPWMGVPTYAEGTLLFLPNANLMVADACSGFSTLYAAITTACLLASTTSSWPVRLLVIGVAAPLAIAANVLRVALLGLVVYWQGSDVLATSLHGASGMLTFALVLPLLFWLRRTAAD